MEENTPINEQRSTIEKIITERNFITSQEFLQELFGAIAGIAAILDSNRQIVASNDDFLKALGIGSIYSILGLRPGEAIMCVNSAVETSGCGTSEACSFCGAMNVIVVSQNTGRKSQREARITSMVDGQLKSWDLLVTSSPVKIKDHYFYILTLEDKSDEKRRITLERIFFHDILNTAAGLNQLLQLLKEAPDPEEAQELIKISEEASKGLIEEIMLHRQMKAAEDGDLKVNIVPTGTIAALKTAIDKIRFHEVANGKTIIIHKESVDCTLETDKVLLQRILINLLKNALEATQNGGIVTVGTLDKTDEVKLWVKNDLVISREIQLQIFQRSFSTKGAGRGIGTYSIRLLSENYLKGNVSFVSNQEEGTIFELEFKKRFPGIPGISTDN